MSWDTASNLLEHAWTVLLLVVTPYVVYRGKQWGWLLGTLYFGLAGIALACLSFHVEMHYYELGQANAAAPAYDEEVAVVLIGIWPFGAAYSFVMLILLGIIERLVIGRD